MIRPLLILTALVASTPAFALDCAFGPSNSLPENGATDVPVNVVFRQGWAGMSAAIPFHLVVDATDEAVEGTWAAAEGTGVAMFTPDADLLPHTSYRVVFEEDVGSDGGVFTTGEASDDVAPDAPVIDSAIRDEGHDRDWGDWRYNHVTLSADEVLFYRVEVADNDAFSGSRFVEIAPWGDAETVEMNVGSGLCGGPIEIDRNERHMRVQAIDMAGNLSDATYVLTDGGSAGCSSTGAAPFGLAALFGLALVVRRRRKEP